MSMSAQFSPQNISSLPVLVTKFEGDKSDHLEQLFVTPEIIARKIKKTKDNKSPDMNVSEQCGIAASKGNKILGVIRRTITYKENQLIVPLYKTIVRTNLEYCIQAWRQYRKKDIDELERIQ